MFDFGDYLVFIFIIRHKKVQQNRTIQEKRILITLKQS